MRGNRVAVVAVAITLGAAACSSGGGGSSNPTTSRATTSTSTTSGPSTTSTTAVTSSTCLVGQLSATIANPSAGAGQRDATVVFTNTGAQPCTMLGYIGMQLLGAGGTIPTNVVRTPGSPALVTLAPGAKASAALQWGAIAGPGEPSNGPCEPEPQQVQVTPPNETHQIVVPWTGGSVCENGTINTKPVQPGAG